MERSQWTPQDAGEGVEVSQWTQQAGCVVLDVPWGLWQGRSTRTAMWG